MNRKERRRAAKLNQESDDSQIILEFGRCVLGTDHVPCGVCGRCALAWPWEKSPTGKGHGFAQLRTGEDEEQFVMCRPCSENEKETAESIMRKRHPDCTLVRDVSEAQMVLEKNEAGDDADLFVIFDGMKIAKRGHPGTPQARTWVSLEPGWRVLDGNSRPDGGGELIIENHGIRLQ